MELEKLKNELVELKKQFREINKKVSKYEEQNKKNKYKDGEEIYYVNTLGDMQGKLCHTEKDRWLLTHTKIFKTQKGCEDYKKYLEGKDKYTYKFSKDDWEDILINKYMIRYDVVAKEFIIEPYVIWKINTDYFKTEEKAQQFINQYGSEYLRYDLELEE